LGGTGGGIHSIDFDYDRLGQAIASSHRPTNQARLTVFSKAKDPAAWHAWRAKFKIFADNKKWEPQEIRQQLCMHMADEVFIKLEELKIDADHSLDTVKKALDRVESVILGKNGKINAKADFRAARQKPEEDILDWSARVRVLMSKAYPTFSVHHDPGKEFAIEKFTDGLHNAAIQAHVMNHEPDDYEDAVDTALTRAATFKRQQTLGKIGPGGTASAGLGNRTSTHAIQAIGEGDKTCFWCKKDGHMQRDCHKYKDWHQKFEKAEAQAQGGVSALQKTTPGGKGKDKDKKNAKTTPETSTAGKKKKFFRKKAAVNSMGPEDEDKDSDPEELEEERGN